MVELGNFFFSDMGMERIRANVLFYFFLSCIIFSVNAWCGGIDGNFQKLL